jgi:diamine N-acetyltransferase
LRGKGIGKALMQTLAQHCVDNDLARFEWTVLDWNKPSIEFYRSIGANLLDDWRVCRMSGEALAKFAGQGTR